MQITKLALVTVLAAQVTVTFAAKPKPLVLSYYDWRDAATNLVLEGRGFPQTAKPLVRLPEKFKGVVTPKVWGLSQSASCASAGRPATRAWSTCRCARMCKNSPSAS